MVRPKGWLLPIRGIMQGGGYWTSGQDSTVLYRTVAKTVLYSILNTAQDSGQDSTVLYRTVARTVEHCTGL